MPDDGQEVGGWRTLSFTLPGKMLKRMQIAMKYMGFEPEDIDARQSFIASCVMEGIRKTEKEMKQRREERIELRTAAEENTAKETAWLETLHKLEAPPEDRGR